MRLTPGQVVALRHVGEGDLVRDNGTRGPDRYLHERGPGRERPTSASITALFRRGLVRVEDHPTRWYRKRLLLTGDGERVLAELPAD